MACQDCLNLIKEKCLNLAELKEKCPCPKRECQYHGLCCECIAAHLKKGQKPPVCLEKVFDWHKKPLEK